jgi:hypothetical protein
MRVDRLRHEFVEIIPSTQEDGVLYISMEYATAVHRCCCGCGEKVVTPLTPKDWRLTYDGRTVALTPSIGNWSLRCRSHYWIERNRVDWAPSFARERSELSRQADGQARPFRSPASTKRVQIVGESHREGWIQRMLSRLAHRNSDRD